MTRRVKMIEKKDSELSFGDLDLDDRCQLPQLMGWAGGHDYQLKRARYMEEIAAELGATGLKKSQGQPEETDR